MKIPYKKLVPILVAAVGLASIIFFLPPQTWYVIVFAVLLSGLLGFYVAALFLKRKAAFALGIGIGIFFLIQALGIGSLVNTVLLVALLVAITVFLSH